MKKRTWIILALILAVGIFLRTYHFSDWLRFNMDQSRDAALIKSLSENNKLPDLGPKAGGTDFKLGPAFYQFQLISAKIFGTEPEKLAYPDLFFSVLSVILFFLLAKIYFKIPLALALTWLYSISYFAVKFSRFAWNPNSTPFFAMLFIFALYNLATSEKRKIPWAILAGIALGICVQLHTSLLIILPIFSLLIAIVFLKEKRIKKTAIVMVIVGAIFVNIPQITSEIKSNGLNFNNFILSIANKNEKNTGIGENLLLNLSCHIKTGSHIVSSLGNEDECDYKSDLRTFKKLDGKRMTLAEKSSYIFLSILSVLFFLGGYFLLFKGAKKEANKNKKIFLLLLSGYVVISFLFYLTWANELAVRFFLPLSFVPFIILGFWLEFFSNKFKKGLWIAAAVVITLSFLNLQKIFHTYADLKNGGREINGDFDYLTLGEGKYIVDFIAKNSGEEAVYIDAQAGYLFKSFRPLRFLAQKYHLELVQLNEGIILDSKEKLFYLKSADSKCVLSDEALKKYRVNVCEKHGQFSIFVLEVI